MSQKFTPIRSGDSNATATKVNSARAIDGSSLSVLSLDGWPDAGNKAHLITYKKKSDGTKDHDTQCDWTAIIPSTGTTLGTLTLMNGTDAGNDVGDYVELVPTQAWAQDLYDGLTKEHNTDGTHGDITADSISTNGSDKLVFSIDSTQPDGIQGKTVVWFNPLDS